MENDGTDDSSPAGFRPNGRRKRKDIGKKRQASRKWTDHEETLFIEALELHGRNWKACANHVGTRDARSFTSHAQKHFVKLWVAGAPLPKKVAETGAGYTLSGKALDPDSAAAKQYASKGRSKKRTPPPKKPASTIKRVKPVDLEQEDPVTPPLLEGSDNEDENGHSMLNHQMSGDSPSSGSDTLNLSEDMSTIEWMGKVEECSLTDGEKQKVIEHFLSHPPKSKDLKGSPEERSSRLRKLLNVERFIQESPVSAPPAPLKQKRQKRVRKPKISKARKTASPTRQSARVARIRHSVGDNLIQKYGDDPLEMVPCCSYEEFPSIDQPFSVEIDRSAVLLCDLHAHMCTVEVIGMLGGTWDPDSQRLVIKKAFPCKSIMMGEEVAAVNVEMDPGSEVEIRSQIAASGLQVVGWYHSHPEFEPHPSYRDIENQLNYQVLFKDHRYHLEPFVGLIVGSYDVRLPTPQSTLTVFNVTNTTEESGTPVNMRYEVSEQVDLSATFLQMADLIDTYKDYPLRVDFTETWRGFATLKEGLDSTHLGSKPISRLEKLLYSLKSRLPSTVSSMQSGELLNHIKAEIMSKWISSPVRGDPLTLMME